MKPESLFIVGIILIFLGILLILLSSFKSSKIEIAFGGFIGFIPFGFATRYELLIILIILLFIISIIFFFLRI